MAACRVQREASPPAADVEHALALAEPELGADHLQLRLLRLLECLCAAREDRAAVGHRLVQEQSEVLVPHVVVVPHRAGVALGTVPAAAWPQLGCRDRWRTGQAAGPDGRERQPGAGRPVHFGRFPVVEQVQGRVQVVWLEQPGGVGTADAELARRPQQMGDRARRAHRESGAGAVCGRKSAPVPEIDGKRARGQRFFQLLAQRGGIREGHGAEVTGECRLSTW